MFSRVTSDRELPGGTQLNKPQKVVVPGPKVITERDRIRADEIYETITKAITQALGRPLHHVTIKRLRMEAARGPYQPRLFQTVLSEAIKSWTPDENSFCPLSLNEVEQTIKLMKEHNEDESRIYETSARHFKTRNLKQIEETLVQLKPRKHPAAHRMMVRLWADVVPPARLRDAITRKSKRAIKKKPGLRKKR